MISDNNRQNAMDQLFGDLGKQESKQSSPQTNATSPRTYNKHEREPEDERICTIMKVETMNKLRYINGKEGIPLRELFEIGAKYLIKEYERQHGPIRVRQTKPKKGDASKIFNI